MWRWKPFSWVPAFSLTLCSLRRLGTLTSATQSSHEKRKRVRRRGGRERDALSLMFNSLCCFYCHLLFLCWSERHYPFPDAYRKLSNRHWKSFLSRVTVDIRGRLWLQLSPDHWKLPETTNVHLGACLCLLMFLSIDVCTGSLTMEYCQLSSMLLSLIFPDINIITCDITAYTRFQ